MSLAKILREKFPAAKWGPPASPFEWDIVLMDDGKGQFLHAWNEAKLGPQPTPDDLAKWLAEYEPPPEPTAQERLVNLLDREGLTVDDLKTALAEPAVAVKSV